MSQEVAVDIPEDQECKVQFEVTPEANTLTSPVCRTRSEYYQQFQAALFSTSIRGLSRALSKKKKKYKVYWITVFGFAVLIFLVNLFNITKRYLRDPILTQLERGERPFTWPHFTFCNPANPIPFSADPTLFPEWRRVFLKAETNYSLPRYDPKRKKKIWEHYMAISSIDPTRFYRQIVKSSIYKLAVIYEDQSIVEYSSSMDLFRSVDSVEKVFDVRLYTIRSPIACMTLMTERLKDVVEDLRNNHHRLIGIKIYFLMDLAAYMKFDMGYENRKLYFYITNRNATILYNFPYYILPGTDSTFRMKERIYKRVTDCTDKKFEFQLYDVSMETTWPFQGDFDDCRSFLSQEHFVRRCGCYNPYLPMYKMEGRRPVLCTNMTRFDNASMSNNINCLNAVLKEKYNSGTFKDVESRCKKFFANPCIERTYSVARYTTSWQETMSESRRRSMRQQKLPNAPADQNYTEEFPRQNLAILKLQWGKEKTEATFEQYEYPLSRFMSDFGGIVGLWIGLSVFSIFEFLEVLYKFVKYKRAA